MFLGVPELATAELYPVCASKAVNLAKSSTLSTPPKAHQHHLPSHVPSGKPRALSTSSSPGAALPLTNNGQQSQIIPPWSYGTGYANAQWPGQVPYHWAHCKYKFPFLNKKVFF